MSQRDPIDEFWHTLKVALLFFTIAAVAFAIHSICDELKERGFSNFYVMPLKFLEFIAFVGDILYLAHHLVNRIIDVLFAFGDTYKRVRTALKKTEQRRTQVEGGDEISN